MDGIGRYFAAMVYAFMAAAFVAGIAFVGVVWAFWHFVGSRISFLWQ